MHGLLFSIIQRRLRHMAVGTTFGMAVVTTAAVATARFHDQRFDTADAAVVQAENLLAIVVCGNPGEKTTAECERYVKRAQELLVRAREAMTAAAAAADGIGSPAHDALLKQPN